MQQTLTPTQIKVDSNYAGQRIDNFLFRELKKIPKSLLYKMLRKGRIRVNKKRVQPDYHLQAHDEIRLPRLAQAITETKAKPNLKIIQRLEQSILYEDEDLIILNKPEGIAVHGGSGINFGVIETMRAARPKIKNLELVHRLDRETSGCLILAKKRSILKELHQIFRQGEIEKKYLALLKGKWIGGKRKVTDELKKSQLQSGERMVKVSAEGKSALTTFSPIQNFDNASLLEIKLGTGRTHQIRVHAAHIGHPVAGDEKYGEKEFNVELRKLGLKRLFLHAKIIHFKLASTKKTYAANAPLPDDLRQVLEKFKSTAQ